MGNIGQGPPRRKARSRARLLHQDLRLATPAPVGRNSLHVI
jgi:hypothetical protein